MVTKKMTYLQLYLENVYFLVQTYNLDLKIIIWCDLDLFSKSNLCRSLAMRTLARWSRERSAWHSRRTHVMNPWRSY